MKPFSEWKRTPKMSEQFKRAADVIRDVGWVQKSFEDTDEDGNLCGVCVMGALQTAWRPGMTYPVDIPDSTVRFLAAVIGLPAELPYIEKMDAIFDWNDDSERTRGQVLRTLKVAESRAQKAGL